MAPGSAQSIGTLFEDFKDQYRFTTAIDFSDEAELYWIFENGIGKDPFYALSTDDRILIEFGETGFVRRIQNGNENLETILERDEQGNFVLSRENIPTNIISEKITLDDTQLTGILINYAYNKARTLEDTPRNKLAELFHHLTANKVLARFDDFSALIGHKDIIPDYNDYMTFVKVSDGCARNCLYCPEGGGIELYDQENIEKHMRAVRSLQERYHTPSQMKLMREGFINSSDILWFRTLKKSTVDPLEIAQLYRQHFPEIGSISAFFGVKNILEVCNTGDPLNPYGSGQYSTEYLELLAHSGINKALVGIETGNTQASALLNKHETYEMKRTALLLLRKAGIGVKAILQMGIFGDGFYRSHESIGEPRTNQNFVSTEKTIDDTARLMAETKPYRVIISEFLPLDGIPLYHHPNYQLISNPNSHRIDNDVNELLQKIEIYSPRYTIHWQGQSQRRQSNNVIPIEFGYQKVVEGRRR